MNSVEERLRAAIRAAAGTVAEGSAPRLWLPETRPRLRPLTLRPSTRRLWTWAAPAAAAIAVLTVIVPATILHDRSTRPETTSGDAAATPPPYFVALRYTGPYKPWKLPRTDAVVGLTATGQTIATVPPPASYGAFVAVSAAADDRRFVLVAQNPARPIPQYPTKTAFYELTIVTNGSRVRIAMSPLPIPVLPIGKFAASDRIALSPDGSSLAVTEGLPEGFINPKVHVYDTATGRERTWYVPSGNVGATPAIRMPSWEANSRYLAVDVSTGGAGKAACLFCVRLLDTASPGGRLLDDSRLLIRSPGASQNRHLMVGWGTTLITPDGGHVLRSASVPVQVTSTTFDDYPWVYVYSARSGTLISSLKGPRGGDWNVLWSSPDGRSYIVASLIPGAKDGFITAARWRGNRRHPIRLPNQTLTASW